MVRFRRLQVLALALALAPLPVHPYEALQVVEALPTLDRCDPPAAPISKVIGGSEQTVLTVSNTSSWTASDVLTLELVVDGQRRLFWATFEVAPHSQATVVISFLREVDSRAIRLCGNHPWSIIESADPVVSVIVE